MYTPNYNNAMMQNEPQEGGSMGSLIGIILIIAIIVLGGIYFWGKNSAVSPADQNATIENIEEDLSATDVSVTDDLNAIDADLQGN